MRVLTFTSLFPNAAQPISGVFIYQRMAHFACRPGNTVQVVAPVPFFPSWMPGSRWRVFSRVPAEEKIGNLTVYHPRYFLLPKVSMPLHGFLIFLGTLGLVTRLQREMGFECIDAHYVYPDGFAAVLLGKLLRVPVVVSARGTDINLFPSFRLIRGMIHWTLQQAAGVIAVCGALKDVMVDLGLDTESIQVIGNGVDPGRFRPLDRHEARRHLGLPDGGHAIVSVGAVIPNKGYQFLIPAFAQVIPRYPGLRLYIVGDGDFRPKLEALALEREVAKQIFFVGARPNEELKYWYSAADISCLTSSREGWPNVLLESMACGTPVLATRVGGVPEIVTSPELGVIVEQNTYSIAAGLEVMLGRTWNREELARSACTRTWDLVAAEVESYLGSRVSLPR